MWRDSLTWLFQMCQECICVRVCVLTWDMFIHVTWLINMTLSNVSGMYMCACVCLHLRLAIHVTWLINMLHDSFQCATCVTSLVQWGTSGSAFLLRFRCVCLCVFVTCLIFMFDETRLFMTGLAHARNMNDMNRQWGGAVSSFLLRSGYVYLVCVLRVCRGVL